MEVLGGIRMLRDLRRRPGAARARAAFPSVPLVWAGVAASSLLLLGCGEASRATEPDLRLEGEITAAKADALERQLRRAEQPVRLTVRSAGGDPAAAARLGRALRARNATLVVDDYCLAGCAQFVFAGAPAREVRPGALVGFHNDLVAGAILLRMRGESPPAALDAAAGHDLGVYEAWGIREPALLDQFTGLDPVCVEWRESARAPRFRANAQIWIPPRAWVDQALGGRTSGWWPSGQAEVDEAGRRVTADLPALNGFRYGAARPFQEVARSLIGRACPAGGPAHV